MLKRHILFLICSLFLWNAIYAEKVTKDVAAQTAVKIMAQQIPGFKGNVQSVTAVTYENEAAYYIVQFAPGGWTLIAADDMSSPLLGYSEQGIYKKDGQPDNIKSWLEGYSLQIRKHSRLNGKKHQGWETADSRPTTRAANGKIAPLLTVNWNQGKPYNIFCPSNSNGTALVGCVAVAMAQAMSVAKYPAKPQGEYSYTSANYGSIYINYDKEPAYDWNAIITGANNKQEVARLLYHCGVSIKMNYGTDGSGTQTSYIPAALTRNFGYPSSVKYYSRTNYSGDWEQLILNELKAGRVVCYSGADLKKGYGHCFNLDGFDGSLYHVNWGWGGANNGYFSLDGLRDATMDMDYTAQQGVVVGIRQPSDSPSDIALSNATVKEKQPAGTVVGKVTVESEATNPTYEYSVRGEYSIILHDYIKAPFIVENGELKTTEALNKEDGDWIIEITATNVNNKLSYTKQFTIHVASASETEETPASRVSMMYDKVKKELTLKSPQPVSYLLYHTETEDVVAEGQITANGTKTISLSDITEGNYTLQLSNAGGKKNIQLIIGKKEKAL